MKTGKAKPWISGTFSGMGILKVHGKYTLLRLTDPEMNLLAVGRFRMSDGSSG